MFRSGFRYWFDQEEIKELQKNNEKYEYTTMEEELLLFHFKPCGKDKGDYFLTTTQIAEYIVGRTNKISIGASTNYNLGRAIRKHGFIRHKKGSVWGYSVKSVPVIDDGSPSNDGNKEYPTINL